MSTWEDWEQPLRRELPEPLAWLPAYAIASWCGYSLELDERGRVVAVGPVFWYWTGELVLVRGRWRFGAGELACKTAWTLDEFAEDLHDLELWRALARAEQGEGMRRAG